MRKFLLNPAVLSAVAGLIPALRASKNSDSKLRTFGIVLAAAGTLAAALASVQEKSAEEREHEEDLRAKSRRRN